MFGRDEAFFVGNEVGSGGNEVKGVGDEAALGGSNNGTNGKIKIFSICPTAWDKRRVVL